MARSPGVGRNEVTAVSDDDWLVAVAKDSIALEARDAVTERRKLLRKRIEGESIVLADLDFVIKHRNDDPDTLINTLKRQLGGLLHFIPNLRAQVDLFTGAPPPAERQAAFHMQGLHAAIAGKAATPPENLATIEKQQWLEGWHRGHTARQTALKDPHVKALLGVLKLARLAKDNDDPDETTTGPTPPSAPIEGPKAPKRLSAEQRAKALKEAGMNPDTGTASGGADETTGGTGSGGTDDKPGAGQPMIPPAALAPSDQARQDFVKDNPDVILPGQPGFVEATAAELAAQAGRKSQSEIAAAKREEAGVK